MSSEKYGAGNKINHPNYTMRWRLAHSGLIWKRNKLVHLWKKANYRGVYLAFFSRCVCSRSRAGIYPKRAAVKAHCKPQVLANSIRSTRERGDATHVLLVDLNVLSPIYLAMCSDCNASELFLGSRPLIPQQKELCTNIHEALSIIMQWLNSRFHILRAPTSVNSPSTPRCRHCRPTASSHVIAPTLLTVSKLGIGKHAARQFPLPPTSHNDGSSRKKSSRALVENVCTCVESPGYQTKWECASLGKRYKKNKANQRICTRIESRSIICWGMQKTGLIARRAYDATERGSQAFSSPFSVASDVFSAFSLESRERPARPKRVWKGSGMLPGRSLIPPVSESWLAQMNLARSAASIHMRRPRIVSEARTHLSQ